MQIQSVQNNNSISNSLHFGEGRVYLKRIRKKDILLYDAMKKTAEKNNLDLKITKIDNSKCIPMSDCYIIGATRDINKHPFTAQQSGSIVLSKQTKPTELSAKLYDAVIKTIKKFEGENLSP